MNPIILYDNRFADGVLSATDTESGSDVNNIKDLRPHTFWKAASYGTKYITRAPLATDDVDLTDLCLALADGYAFVDFSAPGVLTDYIGKRLVVIDSAGKKVIGYIKAASPNTNAKKPLFWCTSGTTVYVAWTGKGIWKYDGTWTKIHDTTPIGMCATSTLMIASFTGDGLYKYDGATWTKLNTDEPTIMSAYGEWLIYSTNYGYKYNLTTDTKTQISASAPLYDVSIADSNILYASFASGIDKLYSYNISTSTWTQITSTMTSDFWAVGTNCYAIFPGFDKVFLWSGSWVEVSTIYTISAGAVVNNADFYGVFYNGIWKHNGGTSWTQVSADIPDDLIGATDKLYTHIDATKTLKSWDGANWATLSTPFDTGVTIVSNPDGSTYNWESIESGFNYDDAAGYAYKISEADACDALFLFGHNLGTAGASVSVESTDDEVNWTERLAAFTPSDDRAIMELLTSFRAASKRLKIVSPSVAPYIAVAILGQRMEFPFPPDSPYDPYNIGIESESELSVQGNHLGDVIYYYPIAQRVVFSNPLRSFITDTYKPFWDTHGRLRKSFAWAWDLTAYPDVVYFMKLTKNARLSMPLSVGTYADSLVLDMEGVAEP